MRFILRIGLSLNPFCRGGQIRTDDLLVPNEARYRATLHPDLVSFTVLAPLQRGTHSKVFSGEGGIRTLDTV
ncbi:MAG: hypothetical protein K0S33_2921 [Bacteroidetes bacterium]|nr:hypothetical protein [Bacteroidota bacterium]